MGSAGAKVSLHVAGWVNLEEAKLAQLMRKQVPQLHITNVGDSLKF